MTVAEREDGGWILTRDWPTFVTATPGALNVQSEMTVENESRQLFAGLWTQMGLRWSYDEDRVHKAGDRAWSTPCRSMRFPPRSDGNRTVPSRPRCPNRREESGRDGPGLHQAGRTAAARRSDTFRVASLRRRRAIRPAARPPATPPALAQGDAAGPPPEARASASPRACPRSHRRRSSTARRSGRRIAACRTRSSPRAA